MATINKNNNKNVKLSNEDKQKGMALSKKNITLLLVGFLIMCLGYVLLCGGGSSSPDQFDAEALFSFRRLTIAPIVIFLGLCFEVYAIMKLFKK